MAGISWRVSRKLLILFADWVSKPSCPHDHAEPNPPRPFSQDAVEALLRTCVGDARRVSAQEAEEHRLWKVAGAVTPWRPDFAVYAALADGRLKARAIRDDLPGLSAILLNSAEVEAAVPPPDASTLTARMVRQRLKVKHATLKTWREAGWLPALGALAMTALLARPRKQSLLQVGLGLPRRKPVRHPGRQDPPERQTHRRSGDANPDGNLPRRQSRLV